ncbi:MAG: DNA topoisomerase VI subunit B [Sedimentisphaerales bacterium]|nr:DNA topoisomerase VI subunit B [Sedimentisphaerales bacterium]
MSKIRKTGAKKAKAKGAESTAKTKSITTKKRIKTVVAATAESMAARQRAISVSEFFAKNRHLLGFDNPRKALLTAVKEAVDNSLDACDEARILPELLVSIKPVTESKFVLMVRDNGPGIVKQQIPNIFARLLYGSKFHSLRMSRGQQGIGISAAGMYGLLTTGEPVQIVSRTTPKKNANHYHVQIDTARNRPEVILDEECDFEIATGTKVTMTLEGKYQKGRQSVDEYIAQTAMANPHAAIVYQAPDGNSYEYRRQTKEMPISPREIKPHPYGVELGLLYKMARDSSVKQLSAFLQNEFSRVSLRVANQICEKAKLRRTLRPSKIALRQAEALHAAINETKIMAPSMDCISPIGLGQLEEGLKRRVDANFYTACSRSPAVYRGNPFLIEAALAYGDKTGGGNGEPKEEPLMRLIRIANRVPLLYQQSACSIYKSVLEVNWRNYGLSQSRGALPTGPVTLMVHMASVWVPFTSESKEAIAHYPEIIREIQLAIQDCGRKLAMYLRKKKRVQQEMDKRRYIETYLPYIGEALQDILILKQKQVDTVVSRLKHMLEKSRKI